MYLYSRGLVLEHKYEVVTDFVCLRAIIILIVSVQGDEVISIGLKKDQTGIHCRVSRSYSPHVVKCKD